MPIAIVDYGAGNLRSVQKALEKLGFESITTNKSSLLNKSSGIILPGVGAFDSAIEELESNDLLSLIKDEIKSGKPFLGLCLGMQLLFDKSEEGEEKGLGIIPGEVKKFSIPLSAASDPLIPRSPDHLKIPHMGWNNIEIKKDSPILKNVPNNSKVYFVHSYFCVPKDNDDILTTTDYGGAFASSISKDNIFAFQFHPEKSGNIGFQILKNFGSMCK